MMALLRQHAPSHAAIITEHNHTISYEALIERVLIFSQTLMRTSARALVFLVATNTLDSIVAYLACLENGYPVCLIEPSALSLGLVEAYRPAMVVAPKTIALPIAAREIVEAHLPTYALHRTPFDVGELHPQLSVLLPTSGSTGSPKVVRLSREAIMSNATSIAQYLRLSPDGRAIASLPMQYSYGLSVLNSHLVAGGTVVLTEHSFIRPEFWATVVGQRCTSFAGVPYMYETLQRLRFNIAKYAPLRTLTQAGGKLRADLIAHFYQQTQSVGAQMFVMYGQTEATARISYVPAERLGDKIGSIGLAIPGGELSLSHIDGSDMDELIYRGANVMMGYADSADSLANGDKLGGVLRTGDLARVDADGFYSIVGRLKRIGKLFGKRFNLEDVESDLEAHYAARAAAIDTGSDQLRVWVAPLNTESAIQQSELHKHIYTRLGVTPSAVIVQMIDALPMTSNGKKDYAALGK